MAIIEEIIGKKKKQIVEEKKKAPAKQLFDAISSFSKPRPFSKAIDRPRHVSFILEHKPSSPSKGFLSDFSVEEVVLAYGRAGASAISVLAESNYFGGSAENVSIASCSTSLPVLFKDFVFDEYQLLQARASGASAVLLMNGVCPNVGAFLEKARELNLECLVECTAKEHVVASLGAGAKIIGINNRDFATLKTDLSRTMELAPRVPKDAILVSESGIDSPRAVGFVSKAGVDSVLVGSHLMKSASIEELENKARELVMAGKGARVPRK